LLNGPAVHDGHSDQRIEPITRARGARQRVSQATRRSSRSFAVRGMDHDAGDQEQQRLERRVVKQVEENATNARRRRPPRTSGRAATALL
jgi:hypothetical protein